eukprot:COSAG06_NODE_47129_length_341_cov_1.061983_1_plen_66_part_01
MAIRCRHQGGTHGTTLLMAPMPMHILIGEYWQSMHLTIRALDLKGEDAIVKRIEILRRAGDKISVG